MSKNKQLNERIKEIEKELLDMENIQGIKKLVTKYNNIQKNVEECKNILKKISESIDSTKRSWPLVNYIEEDDIVNSSSEELENEQFIKNLNELEEIKMKLNNTEEIDIEEVENLYHKSNKIINKCNQYLKEQKMQVINVD